MRRPSRVYINTKIIIVFSIFVYSKILLSSVLHVPSDYKSIQSAINSSCSGDVILVDSGTYYENVVVDVSGIVIRSKNGPVKTVIDGMQKSMTVVFKDQTSHDTILEGFTVINGKGPGLRYSGVDVEYLSTATLKNNRFVNNDVGYFGNMAFVYNNIFEKCGLELQNMTSFTEVNNNYIKNDFVELYNCNDCTELSDNIVSGSPYNGIICSGYSNPIIRNNVIKECEGYGIYLDHNSTALIINNRIYKNRGNPGGGIGAEFSEDKLVIEGNYIFQNSTLSGSGGGISINCKNKCNIFLKNNIIDKNISKLYGGGCYVWLVNDSVIYLENNIFSECSSKKGGGLMLYNIGTEKVDVEVNKCLFFNNKSYDGGGISTKNINEVKSFNCLYVRNYSKGYGGGFEIDYNLKNSQFVNCTFAHNKSVFGGGGSIDHFYPGSIDSVINCIFYSNKANFRNNLFQGMQSYLYAINNNIQGGKDTVGGYGGFVGSWERNIDEDPMFKSVELGDWRLEKSSPCINLGENVDGQENQKDYLGNDRVVMGRVDLGAIEYNGLHSLTVNKYKVFMGSDETISFRIESGEENRGKIYVLLCTVSGTSPGTKLLGSGILFPITIDKMTYMMVPYYSNNNIFNGFVAHTDAKGRASASLKMRELSYLFYGESLSFAYAILDPAIVFVSNPVSVDIR